MLACLMALYALQQVKVKQITRTSDRHKVALSKLIIIARQQITQFRKRMMCVMVITTVSTTITCYKVSILRCLLFTKVHLHTLHLHFIQR